MSWHKKISPSRTSCTRMKSRKTLGKSFFFGRTRKNEKSISWLFSFLFFSCVVFSLFTSCILRLSVCLPTCWGGRIELVKISWKSNEWSRKRRQEWKVVWAANPFAPNTTLVFMCRGGRGACAREIKWEKLFFFSVLLSSFLVRHVSFPFHHINGTSNGSNKKSSKQKHQFLCVWITFRFYSSLLFPSSEATARETNSKKA